MSVNQRGNQRKDSESPPPPGVLSNEFFCDDGRQLDDGPPEIIEGILRVGQFCIFCGYYAIGKSPFLQDLAFHIRNGFEWLGRQVSRRQVFLIDFETQVIHYERNVAALRRRYDGNGLFPSGYLLSAREHCNSIAPLDLPQKWHERNAWIRSLLQQAPDAVIILDPAEHFFHFNRSRSSHILTVWLQLRKLLVEFPQASVILVTNLRKRGRRRNPPSLHTEPELWLEDNAGDLDILNRCDVRLGLDYFIDPALRVLNGVRRGEEMMPIVVRQIGSPGRWGGFENVELTPPRLQLSLTPRQEEYWSRLPEEFCFVEVVNKKLVPRASLSRLIRAARSAGLLASIGGVHRKI